MHLNLVTLAIALLSILAEAKRPSNAILLSTVKSLTLRGDKLTSARRVKAIPQLKCIGGNAKGLYDVDVMRCKNTGSEYGEEDISWTCQATLPAEFKLGSTEVICEGYDSPDDPYVLKGSCGVEYRIALTEQGEAKYGRRTSESGMNTITSALFWLVFLGILGFMLYKVFVPEQGRRGPDNRFPRRYFGSGGGGGGDDDPPPPYSRRPPRTYPKSAPSAGNQAGWQPGFWSGAAAGAATGYLMGNRNNNRAEPPQAGPSNWFNTGARNNQPSNFGFGGGSRQPSSSSSDGPRYESTGFGGTSRR